MTNCKSPINYFGVKALMAKTLIDLFPPHRIYVEAFGGSGAVLLMKEPSQIELYNDIDKELHNLFQVLRDKDMASELEYQLGMTLYSRNELMDSSKPEGTPIERARRFIVRQRQSFSAAGISWLPTKTNNANNEPDHVARWKTALNRIPPAVKRLSNVQIECRPWQNVIPSMDAEDALFYLDPPYVPDARVHGGYTHEMDADEHVALVTMLLSLKGMVVLSGYDTPIYRPLDDAGWVRKTYDVVARSSDTRAARTEVVWLSPRVADHVNGLSKRQMSILDLLPA